MSVDSICQWPTPPKDLGLPGDEVHVWCAFLDPPLAVINYLRAILSTDELSRAARFRFDRHRRRFVVRRGILRILLGSYLDETPERLRFSYSDYGKPTLATGFGWDLLRFNLSHTSELALLAFSQGRQIGVDVERIRIDFDHEQIAEGFFSHAERFALSSLPAELKPRAFFNCWTRKEAFIKAHGEGLSLPLDQFDVSLIPGEPARLLETRGDLEGAQRWHLQHLDLALDYVAALAVEGHGWQLRYWRVGEFWSDKGWYALSR